MSSSTNPSQQKLPFFILASSSAADVGADRRLSMRSGKFFSKVLGFLAVLLCALGFVSFSAVENHEMKEKMPIVFAAHGGGPLPLLGQQPSLAAWLQGLRKQLDLPQDPKHILVLSAHWEEEKATVQTSASPEMLFDYYGFPKESYTYKYPAAGDPKFAAHVADLLKAAGIQCKEDNKRGFDHGVFVPLLMSFPKADIPTIQLSLVAGLDPALHYNIGRALAPLREEGVLIFGSGMSFHGGRAEVEKTEQFDSYLREAVFSEREKRSRMLLEWKKAPFARVCHPREEHLIPLMVCAGAALDDTASLLHTELMWGNRVSCFGFGVRANHE